MADKITAPKLRTMRERGEKLVCVTAYDSAFASIADEAGVDVILVGDSVGNVMLGYPNTVPVTLEDMLHHTRAVATAVRRALLVADLPFGSYESSVAKAVDSAVLLAKAGAEVVKLEGAYPEVIEAITRAGLPVMGHLGMTPQSVNVFGGHRVQGRGHKGAQVLEDARVIAEAGACSMVLELVPSELSARITAEVDCPTIGIGAGSGCDGQIQVMHDLLGLSSEIFKHSKAYMSGRTLATEAFRAYASEVRSNLFPTEEQSF